jgi:23S rRNA (cytidine1920-2'-O)/16S rRNA (cytidine1409-2'-O)-methyltransferase
VVRDPAIHAGSIARVASAAGAIGLGSRDVIASPILGPEGNREFLLYIGLGPGCADLERRIGEVTGR